MWPMLNCGLRSVPNLFWGNTNLTQISSTNTNLIKISSSQMFSELKKQTLPQDLIDRDKYILSSRCLTTTFSPNGSPPTPLFWVNLGLELILKDICEISVQESWVGLLPLDTECLLIGVSGNKQRTNSYGLT